MSLVQQLVARARVPACPRHARADEIVRKLEAMPAKQARALEVMFSACGEPSARQLDAILGALPLQSMADRAPKAKKKESKQSEPEQNKPEQGEPGQTEPEQDAPEQGAPEQGAPEQGAPEQD